jgi:hypothetical protein
MTTKTASIAAPADGAAKYRASVDQCIAEVDRIVRRIRRKDTEIEKSQKRTRAMLTELAAMR